jgi:hypothetical protein
MWWAGPQATGYRPLMSVNRDGAQTGIAKQRSYNTPSRANLSIVGVLASASP